MSIPKSISLFLASVLVAIPTALTGIHLAKPKPLVHMNDELIELDEREEIQEPEEIKPKPKPESKPDSSFSVPALPPIPTGSRSQSGGSQGEEQQQILPEGGDQEEDEVEEEGSNPPEQPQPPEEKSDEEPPANEEEETQDNESENNDKTEPESGQDKEEPKEQELKDFLIQLIPLLIESSKKYKSGDPSLFDTYSVMSGLADLNSTLESYKQLQGKAAQDKEK